MSLLAQVGLCSQGSLYLAQQSSAEPTSDPATPRPIIEAFDLNFRVGHPPPPFSRLHPTVL